MKSRVERPENTLSPRYLKYRATIRQWHAEHKEYMRDYQREYQRNLRKDPNKYSTLVMSVLLRRYLTGRTAHSPKAIAALGMTRTQLAEKYNMSEAEFVDFVKRNEVDHLLSSAWFNKPENRHLKQFRHRHYNLQFVPSQANRRKNAWTDDTDPRIQLVLTLLQIDHKSSILKYTKKELDELSTLAKEAKKLRKLTNKMK